MTMASTCWPSSLTRSDVVACIIHLRAFAIMLAGNRRRADDLVHDTIMQTFTAVSWPPTGMDLKVQMFAGLSKLHSAALRQSVAAQQSEPHLSKEGCLESYELLRIFALLREEQREALILTVASGLSHEQAAQVCDCHIDTIKNRILEAWREMSRMMREASSSDRSKSKRSLKSAHSSWSLI